MTISFRVYGLPQTKGSTRSFYVKKLGRAITTNDNSKNKNWSTTITGVAQEHRPEKLWLGPVHMYLQFHLPKPGYVQKKRKKCWPTKKPDLSKMTRSVEDALTGVVWKDDAQIIESKQEKIYSDAPGVEITVTEIGEDGRLLL